MDSYFIEEGEKLFNKMMKEFPALNDYFEGCRKKRKEYQRTWQKKYRKKQKKESLKRMGVGKVNEKTEVEAGAKKLKKQVKEKEDEVWDV